MSILGVAHGPWPARSLIGRRASGSPGAGEGRPREVPQARVASAYAVPRGALQSLQTLAATYCGMVCQLCRRLRWHEMAALFASLEPRLNFGVSAEAAWAGSPKPPGSGGKILTRKRTRRVAQRFFRRLGGTLCPGSVNFVAGCRSWETSGSVYASLGQHSPDFGYI